MAGKDSSALKGHWRASEEQRQVWEAYADTLLTEDFSYHPFRLAACEPAEMLRAYETGSKDDGPEARHAETLTGG